MTSAQLITATCFRETLLTISGLPALLGLWNGQTKIFWEHVDEDVPLPYIVTSYMMGGEDNSAQSRASDITMKVVAHTANMAEVPDLMNAISGLQNLLPVCTTFSSIAIPYTTIEEEMPVFDRYTVQNNPLFVVGGLYRLRLSIEE